MERSIFFCHSTYDRSHVMQLLLVLGVCPLVLPFWKEFLVVLCRVIECVEQVLEVVEPDHIVLCRRVCTKGQ